MKIFIIIVIVVSAIAFLFRPVCYHFTAEDLKGLSVPVEQLEQRGEYDFYVKEIQKNNNEWYQCKTYLSNILFF